MRRVSTAAFAVAALIGLMVGALAAPGPVRVRGQIQSRNGDTLSVKSYDGNTVKLALNSQTRYETVVPARLSDIKSGDFVGVGATGPENDLNALEIVIFPASMRGTGEGHYGWTVPGAVANADQHAIGAGSDTPPVKGTMTNGTVVGPATSATAPPIQGTMTNGTVTGNANKGSAKTLMLAYSGGRQTEITVPLNAPVVRLTPAQPSDAKPGAKIFALASGSDGSTLTAKSVAIGKNGLMPPM